MVLFFDFCLSLFAKTRVIFEEHGLFLSPSPHNLTSLRPDTTHDHKATHKKTFTMKYSTPLLIALATAKLTTGQEESVKVRGETGGVMRDLKRMSQFRNTMRNLEVEDNGTARKLMSSKHPPPTKELTKSPAPSTVSDCLECHWHRLNAFTHLFILL